MACSDQPTDVVTLLTIPVVRVRVKDLQHFFLTIAPGGGKAGKAKYLRTSTMRPSPFLTAAWADRICRRGAEAFFTVPVGGRPAADPSAPR
jgi:hypothetical protein